MLNPSQFETIEQVTTFLQAADIFSLEDSPSSEQKAAWLRDRLLHFHYRDLPRSQQGLLRQFFGLITGYSPAQLSRHIRTYRDGKPVRKAQKRKRYGSRVCIRASSHTHTALRTLCSRQLYPFCVCNFQ